MVQDASEYLESSNAVLLALRPGFGKTIINNLIEEAMISMGVEWPDTVDSLFATELAIREVEVQVGFSASNEDFFKACQEVG